MLVEFTHTRSAYIAQTALYGYLKTRMGTRYREIFADPEFQPSLNKAKWETFAACLSDLSVFVAATVYHHAELTRDEAVALSRYCLEESLSTTFGECDLDGLADQTLARFNERLAWVNFEIVWDGEKAFTASPDQLLASAPVIDEFKEYDGEIVRNSIRFKWRDIRERFRKRVDAQALAVAWRGIAANS